MYQANVYKIMIGCPSDIIEEIQIAKEVLNHWNDLHSERDKIVLLPLHWSISSYPTMGKHPQKSINEHVVGKSDLLICIFGTKLGTPTDTEISGTVEEIKEHRKAGKDVMAFFKKSVDDITAVEPQQLQKINDFKNSIKNEALWWEFSNADEFKDILFDKLQLYINDNWTGSKSAIEAKNSTFYPIPQIKFSKEEYEILKEWVLGKNGDLIVMGTPGNEHYMLGNKTYSPQDGKDRAEFKDFVNRLKYKGYIEPIGYNIYALNLAAYDYVANQEKGNLANLSKRQQEILQVFADNKVLTIQEISMKTGMSDVAVKSNLTVLQNMGLLVRENGRMGGKWRVKTD